MKRKWGQTKKKLRLSQSHTTFHLPNQISPHHRAPQVLKADLRSASFAHPFPFPTTPQSTFNIIFKNTFCYLPSQYRAAVTFGLESANVVGYQTMTETVSGFNFYAPSFVGINGDLSLQDIKLSGEGIAEGTVSLQKLDEGGVTLGEYTWYDENNSPAGAEGWFDWSTFTLAEGTVVQGEGVLIASGEGVSNLSITSSGAVSKDITEITTVAGFNFSGNASPVAIDIQKIKLVDSSNLVGEGKASLQFLDEGGVTTVEYTWYDANNSPAGEEGWFDWSTFSLATGDINPSQGFLISCEIADVVITMPAAL